MASLLAFLSTTTGLLVAAGALVGALAALVTALVKLSGTRTRLGKLEKEHTEIRSSLVTLKRRQDRHDAQARVDAKVESVRSSLLPEHADAAELDELRAEVAALKNTYEAEMRRLNYAFGQIEGSVRLLVDGKVKLQ